MKHDRPTKEQLRDMEAAHAEGLHDDLPREFCPACEAQKGARAFGGAIYRKGCN